MPLLFLLVLFSGLASCQGNDVELGVATIDDTHFCVGFRPDKWLPNGFKIEANSEFQVSLCEESTETNTKLLDENGSCNESSLSTSLLLVKAPFSTELTDRLNSHSAMPGVIQIRGDIKSALEKSKTMILQPVHLKRIYWGSIIMYFFSLVYVTMSAVLVEVGRQVVQKHAPDSVLEKVRWTQSRAFLITFLAIFAVVIVVAFSGYILKPAIFQPVFAAFLFSLAIVGFYHAVFPITVFILVRSCDITHKTYWLVERSLVILTGMVLFGLWVQYRLSLSMWPVHLALMTCVGIVPLRYAPVDCISKMLVLGVISVLFSLVQRFLMPQLTGSPPTFVDIVAVKAVIPTSISPGPIFQPDFIEPNMLHFRIPMFGPERPCSTVIDGSFGMMNFLLPSIFIKTALQLDKRTEHKSVFMKNYTVAVVAYLVCHTAVFVWSFVEETPVNSNLLYLPGIMITVILNSLRMGYLKVAFFPPSKVEDSFNLHEDSHSEIPARSVVIYKVTDADDEVNSDVTIES